MKIEILPDADAAAQRGAEIVADAARSALAARGKFVLAVSGGRAPWQMLRLLAAEPLDWDKVHVLQVDERVAPAGDPARNLTHLQESLLGRAALPAGQIYAMPVEQPDLEAAARQYADTLRRVAGDPPVIDLVHLGLGPDGHTASLVPGDPALDIRDAPVATSGEYQGRRRMTLTYPTLNAARAILWLAPGADKADALARLLRADPRIPAGRVEQSRAILVADQAAMNGAAMNAAAEIGAAGVGPAANANS
jgi:6-phosphogluconolactonase